MSRRGEAAQAVSPLLEAWRATCRRKPAALAVTVPAENRDVTFAQLDGEATRLRTALASFRLERRAVVLHLPNSPEWLVTFLALRSLGALVIAVDDAITPERVHEVARHFKAAGIYGPEGFVPQASPARRWKSGCALVKLTSGTSGTPKGIVFTDAEMLADAGNILATMGIGETDRNFCLHPLGHSYALGSIVYPLLGFGVPVAIGSAPLPGVLADELHAAQATVLPTVPAVLEILGKSTVESLAPLRLVISAAAPLRPELARAFLEKFCLHVHNFYGSSETGGIAYDVTGEAGLSSDALGAPLRNVSLSLSPGGRLCVRSLAVSHYGRRMSVHAPVTCQLADRAQLEGGLLTLLGRTDRTVKLAGRRVNLDTLEQSLAAGNPGARLAAFLRGDNLCVAVERDTVDIALFQSTVRELAPGRSRIIALKKLPRTGRGKIDQAALNNL